MPRKLILQMHISADGYVTDSQNSVMGWTDLNWTQDIKDIVTGVLHGVDEILLGRKCAETFIPHWRASDEPGSEFINSAFATVFSSTLEKGTFGDSVRIVSGPLEDEVRRLKGLEGKDMIVYGGVEFVQSLVEAGLIDEFFLLTEPVALGVGNRLFTSRVLLELVEARKIDCGMTLLHYKLKG